MRHLLLIAMASLVLLSISALLGCPTPAPPGPVYPGPSPISGTPIDCTTFEGKYQIADTVKDSPHCTGVNTTDVLILHIGAQDEQSGQWDASVTVAGNIIMRGLAKHLADNPAACRFVFELDEALTQDLRVTGRDFVLGEVAGKGRGEATVHDRSCTWQSASTLDMIP